MQGTKTTATFTGDKWLSAKDIQKKLSIGQTKAYELLNIMKCRGDGYLKLGRAVRVKESALDDFLNERAIEQQIEGGLI